MSVGGVACVVGGLTTFAFLLLCEPRESATFYYWRVFARAAFAMIALYAVILGIVLIRRLR